ncbi:MAG: 4Fe-4S dicluster domain-containing protein [Candidatus Micrarchaeota archaeon]
MYRMSEGQVPDFLDYISRNVELIIPYRKDGVSYFKKYEPGDKPFLGKGNTDYSVKPFFFPYKDAMFKYTKDGDIQHKPEAKERVIFGVRPCDLHGISVTDMFFSNDIKDPHYMELREKTILIALDCTIPGKNCFCDSLGKRNPIGHDVVLFHVGKHYYARSETDRGRDLIEGSGVFKESEDIEQPKRSPCKKSAAPVENSKIKWEKWGKQCFGCSACTAVCPTCVCFDVEDEVQLDGNVERNRLWASCFTKDFTTVAGNHCFRLSHTEMLKQFVNHKFSYFEDEFGVTMCVGCGRCIGACTAKIDISKIISGK